MSPVEGEAGAAWNEGGLRLASRGGRLAKRCFDVALASLFIVALSPVFLAIWAAIRLTSHGPALFTQKRLGEGRRVISVYKFRTLRAESCDPPDASVVKPVADNDPRLIAIGDFLRQRGLDELPQLFNVLNGDMSIVGPRPHAIPHDLAYAALIPAYALRHRVKPGITGWAQVNGSRGGTETLQEMEERVRLDLDYIQRWSPGLDLAIVLRSVRIALLGAT
jgi:lipopolysaccharide/colanic/teichoic acid biosynthesis glycosyltransferase